MNEPNSTKNMKGFFFLLCDVIDYILNTSTLTRHTTFYRRLQLVIVNGVRRREKVVKEEVRSKVQCMEILIAVQRQ